MKLRKLMVAFAFSACALWASADSTIATTVDSQPQAGLIEKMTFDNQEPDMVTLHFADGQTLKADLELVSVSLDHSGNTAIDEILADPAKVSGVYNLKGQRVADSPEGLAPGVYVSNGIKILVK